MSRVHSPSQTLSATSRGDASNIETPQRIARRLDRSASWSLVGVFSPWVPQRLSVGWLDMVITTSMLYLEIARTCWACFCSGNQCARHAVIFSLGTITLEYPSASSGCPFLTLLPLRLAITLFSLYPRKFHIVPIRHDYRPQKGRGHRARRNPPYRKHVRRIEN